MENQRQKTILEICEKAIRARDTINGDRYGRHLNDTHVLTLLPRLLKGELVTLWSNEDPAPFLKDYFPADHRIWNQVKVKQVTRHNRDVESGLYHGITLRDKLIVLTAPFKRDIKKPEHKGFEQFRFELDGSWGSFNINSVDVYRNAHNRKTWGSRHNQVFQGADYPKIQDVVASGLGSLIGGSSKDRDIQQAARKLIRLTKFED